MFTEMIEKLVCSCEHSYREREFFFFFFLTLRTYSVAIFSGCGPWGHGRKVYHDLWEGWFDCMLLLCDTQA